MLFLTKNYSCKHVAVSGPYILCLFLRNLFEASPPLNKQYMFFFFFFFFFCRIQLRVYMQSLWMCLDFACLYTFFFHMYNICLIEKPNGNIYIINEMIR